MARTARNVIAGAQTPLPEWDDLGDFFNEGLRLVGVMLVYLIPYLALVSAIVIPAGILGSIRQRGSCRPSAAGSPDASPACSCRCRWW